MKKGLSQSLLVASLLGSSLPASLAADSVQGAIDFRESVMTTFKWYMGPMGAMAKDKIPFDSAHFRSRAEGLANATRLDVSEGFPEGSIGESEARPEIWQEWDEFVAAYEALRKEAEKLQQVAASGDETAMKAQFAETGKQCGDCHKKFRKKK